MTSLWGKFKQGLKKSSTQFSGTLKRLFTHQPLSEEQWEELSDLLIMADLGVSVSTQFLQQLQTHLKRQQTADGRALLAQLMTDFLKPYACPLQPLITPGRPWVMLAVGVNGSGKTTTLGKLAALWAHHRVRLVAGDTFRAAATEQLVLWARHAPCTVGHPGSDPASVIYTGLQEAFAQGDEIILIDTAGRLPNKAPLMEELQKIHRVISQFHPDYAQNQGYERICVLDATTGQNALTQVELFNHCLPLTGLILTKLDGTAKGGILLNLTQRFHLPVRGLGMGEKVDDFCPFDAALFAHHLCGLEEGEASE